MSHTHFGKKFSISDNPRYNTAFYGIIQYWNNIKPCTYKHVDKTKIIQKLQNKNININLIN